MTRDWETDSVVKEMCQPKPSKRGGSPSLMSNRKHYSGEGSTDPTAAYSLAQFADCSRLNGESATVNRVGCTFSLRQLTASASYAAAR